MNIPLPKDAKKTIFNAGDVFGIMRKVLLREEKIDREREHFWIIGLMTNQTLLFIELVTLGSVNLSVTTPMNVFRVAVMKGAVNAVLVHNRPSSGLDISEDDQEITDRLIQVGRILGIPVRDHLVITTDAYRSFEDIGLMQTLRQSTVWVPSFELEARIRAEERKLRTQAVAIAEEKAFKKGERKGRKEGQEKGIQKGRKEGKIEMARALKQQGVDVNVIMAASGLSQEEINSLIPGEQARHRRNAR